MLKLAALGLLTLAGATSALADTTVNTGHEAQLVLHIPGRSVNVAFPGGMIANKGISDPCLETVSRAGQHELVITRPLGGDQARVLKNGEQVPLGSGQAGLARTGSFRIAPDGSLVYLRTWKSGTRQVELVQDGEVVRAWAPGSTVRLVRFSAHALTMIVREPGKPGELVQVSRTESGRIASDNTILRQFSGCLPSAIRPVGDGFLLDLPCRRKEAALFYLDPVQDSLDQVLVPGQTASFAPLEKSAKLKGKVAVVTAGGSANALNLYQAVTGLLLSQTGEPKSCASDAEGLQSWNQSYRLIALGQLNRTTGHPVFAQLASKSIGNTLRTMDGARGTQNPGGASCGWSSRIYSSTPGVPLTLMINQAVIANSLANACAAIGLACPAKQKAEIAKLKTCLVRHFEPQFDPAAGLYRIAPEDAFRFAGKLAPWNWQVSFAALLASTNAPGSEGNKRARDIVARFLREWDKDTNGAMWRYWPDSYYMENGLARGKIKAQRYEDTGHAGISLMSLAQFAEGQSPALRTSVGQRLATIVNQGPEPARDLDGSGPKSARWFPATGWASYAYPGFGESYARLAGGGSSAKAVYTHAQLFRPDAPFELTIRAYACDSDCSELETYVFESAQAFLTDYPLFTFTQTPGLPDGMPNSGN